MQNCHHIQGRTLDVFFLRQKMQAVAFSKTRRSGFHVCRVSHTASPGVAVVGRAEEEQLAFTAEYVLSPREGFLRSTLR